MFELLSGVEELRDLVHIVVVEVPGGEHEAVPDALLDLRDGFGLPGVEELELEPLAQHDHGLVVAALVDAGVVDLANLVVDCVLAHPDALLELLDDVLDLYDGAKLARVELLDPLSDALPDVVQLNGALLILVPVHDPDALLEFALDGVTESLWLDGRGELGHLLLDPGVVDLAGLVVAVLVFANLLDEFHALLDDVLCVVHSLSDILKSWFRAEFVLKMVIFV